MSAALDKIVLETLPQVIIGNGALDDVVAIVRLRNIVIWIDLLANNVLTRGQASDIDPLTVKVTAVEVTTVYRNSLGASYAAVGGILTWQASRVLEAETGLVAFSNPVPTRI